MKGVDKCREACNTRCESIRYDMRASRARLTDAIRNDLADVDHINMTGIPTRDLIRLDIAFSRMEFAELVQEESKTIAVMISDIGGTLNFWVSYRLNSITTG